jgi:hypothetical protein
MYGLRNKLECLSLNTSLGLKGLPGTNTLDFYGNRTLRPYDTGSWGNLIKLFTIAMYEFSYSRVFAPGQAFPA